MGISATTKDSVATLKIYNGADDPFNYQFTRFRIYCNADSSGYEVSFDQMKSVEKITRDRLNGFIEFQLAHPYDTLSLSFNRLTTDTTASFTLYGIYLLNDEPGMIYNAIGVNGASLGSYLRCQLFTQQLLQYPPDLVIISIGTNDANETSFSKEKYREQYIRLIQDIRSTNPNCALLLTVPNDNYYRYRYPQKNIAKCREVIYDIAKQYNAGVWDFYEIMGGFGSSQKWYRDHLMKKDRIHFTKEGYDIKGDLLYEAFLKWYALYKQKASFSTSGK
jgi:lysophospholipase L1-like esterase